MHLLTKFGALLVGSLWVTAVTSVTFADNIINSSGSPNLNALLFKHYILAIFWVMLLVDILAQGMLFMLSRRLFMLSRRREDRPTRITPHDGWGVFGWFMLIFGIWTAVELLLVDDHKFSGLANDLIWKSSSSNLTLTVSGMGLIVWVLFFILARSYSYWLHVQHSGVERV